MTNLIINVYKNFLDGGFKFVLDEEEFSYYPRYLNLSCLIPIFTSFFSCLNNVDS